MGHLGLLLFVSPVQHRAADTVVDLAETAAAAGHSVSVFLLGDGVYLASRSLLTAPEEGAVHRLARLGDRVEVVSCSTCARFRGLREDDLVPNARSGTLEDLVDLFGSADRLLSFTGES